MPNPLAQAIKSGIKANAMIGGLFADIGNDAHPRGFVQSAYRNARRSMISALKERDRLAAASDVMRQLRRSIQTETLSLFADAQNAGAQESAKQMRFYEINTPDPSGASVRLSTQLQSALDTVLLRVDSQTASIRAMIITNQDESRIVGDESRTGILRASDIALTASFWTTALLWDAFDFWTRSYSGGVTFQKQAVAALDARTTDCCLRVHGQVQPMESPFKLTGEPRFADEVDWPAFHWYCRTAGVLYLPEFDEGLTAKMREGANYFLLERAKGNNPDRDPADAF